MCSRVDTVASQMNGDVIIDGIQYGFGRVSIYCCREENMNLCLPLHE